MSAKFLPLLLALLSAAVAPAQVPDTLRHSIPDPNTTPQTSSQQGSRVAVDGNLAVVSSPTVDVYSNGDSYSGGDDSGVVKVYDPTTGALLHTLANPSPESGYYFGISVAVSGSRVVVGAYQAGRIYVYDLAGATPTVPVATLNNPSPALDDYFGGALAISGDRVVVGAYGADVGANEVGRAYVYDLAGATPAVPVAVLDNPSPAGVDIFGDSVAVSGSWVVVGAQGDDTGATDAGSAYVYDLASATPTVPVITLNNPSPASGDYFGHAVAISGSRVVVGARGDGTGASNAGSAYVYDLANATPAVPVAVLNNPAPNPYDFFGQSVAISGNRVVVGADWDSTGATNAGSAYVYDLDGATPTVPVAVLNNPSPGLQDFFSTSLAISGSRVVVGAALDDTGAGDAGSAYAYDLASATPTVPVAVLNHASPPLEEHFGNAVAISGSWLVVGAPQNDTGAGTFDAGRAYVFDLASATPAVPVVVLNNPSPADSDYFGNAVAISGNRVVVGAEWDDTGGFGSGSAYVYNLASATPTVPVVVLNNPSPASLDLFGNAVAISGNRVVVGARGDATGASNAGSAYVYDMAGATPTVPVRVLNNPSPAANDIFGISVAISGNRVVVGAYGDDTGAINAGSAYVYDLSGGTPTVPVAVLNNPSPASDDAFGYAVAISGSRVVVGAYLDDAGATDAGSAYVYELAGATPTVPVAVLNNPSPVGGDAFGWSVGISGTRVVVGAYKDDTGATDAGSAYVYDLSNATPTAPVAVLNNSSPASSDYFGSAVAIDGTTVAVGAYLDDTNGTDRGAAYVFAPANPDYDGDGLLDLWEYAHFGSLTAHTASDDSDGDGRKELIEQAFNTDPLLSDPLAMPAVVSEGGFLTITLSKRAGVAYTVETAGTPDAAAFSLATTTMITNNATTLKVRDNFTPATAAQRFLRVKVAPAP